MGDVARYKIIVSLFVIASIVLGAYLLEHQILNKDYRTQAQDRTLIKRTIPAPRGIVYDRNKELLIVNEPTYELEMIYREIKEDMDIQSFCALLQISEKEYEDLMNSAMSKSYFRKYIPITFLSNIDPLIFAQFQEHLFRFEGFYPRLKNKRSYPYPNAAHVLGYISEVNVSDIKQNPEIYSIGDIKGTSGVESVYEDQLRGQKGLEYLLKDNVGRAVESFRTGNLDLSAKSGNDLTTTLDIRLQAFAEELMTDKKGGIVALDPKTGEVLTMVSSPSYDPNLLSLGRTRSSAFFELLSDTINDPFLDRALQAKYPPGSIFKPILSLIAMQEQMWYHNKPMLCSGEYDVNKRKGFVQGCRDHPHPYTVQIALEHSCNTYYYQMIRDYLDRYGFNNPGKAMDELMAYLEAFGIGKRLGIDLNAEASGFRPSAEFYDKRINTREYTWRSTYVLSLGIGQGELELTTLQMANLAAILANRGYYYTPHLIKEFGDDQPIGLNFTERKTVPIDSIYFRPVIDGMERVIRSGTGTAAYVPGLRICGKTGTSQNVGIDHSVFFGFAPKDDPKIAIAVYVENAGGGGAVAAPIGGLMMEKFINGDISTRRLSLEKNIKELNLIGQP